MVRIVCLLPALIPVMAVAAAPAPPPTDKELIARYWGRVEGDAEFHPDGQRLTLRLTSGRPNHQFRWTEKTTIPRTVQTVRGDFEMTVRILDALPPLPESRSDYPSLETNAGLYVQGLGSSFHFYLNQTYFKINNRNRPELRRSLGTYANYPRGSASGSVKQVEDGQTVYLRILRQDGAVTISYSFDGAKWSAPVVPFRNVDLAIPDEVAVGVFFSHTTYQFAHATFDRFTIRRPHDPKNK
ncbi:MAG: hypothetical protein RMJ56_14630 [Gemmataceae bacterium]|nr:DUF1349 domain-containing protein [Gemmata sp.]MDW8198830.1 hypothetical protein [Gemmataceae bacterium]